MLYQKIKSHLNTLISAGAPGAALPSENQLAIKFGVSRITVRKALDELKSEDKIYKIHGKGTFISLPTGSAAVPQRIAFILPSAVTAFSDDLVQGVTTFCRDMNLRLILLMSRHSVTLERQHLKTAAELGCTGILAMPIDTETDNYVEFEKLYPHIPLVFIDRPAKTQGTFSCVSSDHRRIGYTAAKYLIDGGHSQIALISNTTRRPKPVLDRRRGYREALLQLAGTEKFYLPSYPAQDKIEYYENYFTKHPEITGIIVSSGEIGYNPVLALKRLGRSIPKDVTLVLIDTDNSFLSDYLSASVPTIVQDGFSIGTAACEELLSQTRHPSPPQEIFIPIKLQII